MCIYIYIYVFICVYIYIYIYTYIYIYINIEIVARFDEWLKRSSKETGCCRIVLSMAQEAEMF